MQEKLVNTLNKVVLWDIVLTLPTLLLFTYLPADHLYQIFINLILFVFIVIGILTVSSFVREKGRRRVLENKAI